MANDDSESELLWEAFHALFDVGEIAVELSHDIERMEHAIRRCPHLSDGWYYVPTVDPQGTELHVPRKLRCGLSSQSGDLDSRGLSSLLEAAGVPHEIRPACREVVNRTLELRKAIGLAVSAVGRAADLMDGSQQPAAQRWSVRAVSVLQRMRGGLLAGALQDSCPTALPVPSDEIGQGLQSNMKELAELLSPLKAAARVAESRAAAFSAAQDREKAPNRMSRDVARLTAEALVKSEGFPRHRGKPSVRKLAEKVGCSPSTMRNAIDESLKLQRAKATDASTESDELSGLIAQQAIDDASNHA